MLANHPILTKLLCVGPVVAVMFPSGRLLFPLIGHEIGAIEAVVSTSLGYGLYAVLFG